MTFWNSRLSIWKATLLLKIIKVNLVCSTSNILSGKRLSLKSKISSAASETMIKEWFTKFLQGRTIRSDRSGNPIEVAPAETIKKIHELVLVNRIISVCKIMKPIGISQGSDFGFAQNWLQIIFWDYFGDMISLHFHGNSVILVSLHFHEK